MSSNWGKGEGNGTGQLRNQDMYIGMLKVHI